MSRRKSDDFVIKVSINVRQKAAPVKARPPACIMSRPRPVTVTMPSDCAQAGGGESSTDSVSQQKLNIKYTKWISLERGPPNLERTIG